ncbi:MAG: hypothetical protein VX346_16115 [Planctomycetota bacterium]|nr:hypothetical protein [Planctomycetota bacterium]
MNYQRCLITLILTWGATVPGQTQVTQTANQPQKEISSPPRRYQEGPLTVSDFRGKVPRDAEGKVESLLAFTKTDFRYSWKSTFARRNRRHYLTATNIDLYSVMLPQHSWNRAPRDQRLLDHEQGHFDITEVQIRKAILQLKDPSSRKLFRSSGNSRTRAVQRFEKNLARFLEPFVAASRKHHERYDKVTKHGSNRPAQEHERRKQKLDLQRLAEQIRPREASSHRSQTSPE